MGGLSRHAIAAVMRRELAAYFATPLAMVFLIVFLLVSGAFTFYLGGFFERGQADLQAFFQWHPWLYIVLVPALAMRLWAEESRAGTIEVLLTMPIGVASAVLGKFLAAWLFLGLALTLTTPIWMTVSYLGDPDHGTILAGYIGSFAMAGGYLALAGFLSALTRNQVIAFVAGVCATFIITVSGAPVVTNFFSGWAGPAVTGFISQMSFITHFGEVMRGAIELRAAVYFLSLILLFLFATWLAVERQRR